MLKLILFVLLKQEYLSFLVFLSVVHVL